METPEEVIKTIDKLRIAWEVAPKGSKSLILKYGLSNQNATDILRKGRKKEKEGVIKMYLEAIKRASAEIAQDVNDRNNQVQAL